MTIIGLIKLIKYLMGENHPETEGMEKKSEELERIMREEPEKFREMVYRYSNILRYELWEHSGKKIFFDIYYTPAVAWDIVEHVLKSAEELGIIKRRRGIQGEYIDVNPEVVEKLDGKYNLWAFWLAKEMGLPKEVWLDAARVLNPSFSVFGVHPAEIDGIRLYVKGKKEEAERIWRNAGVNEKTVEDYKLFLDLFLKDLEKRGILEKAKKIMEQKERALVGAPPWFEEYLVGERIGELEKMGRVHPDLVEVNVLVPLRTAYRVFGWLRRRFVQGGSFSLVDFEGFLSRLVGRRGVDSRTVQWVRGEVREWVRLVGEGVLSEGDVADRVLNYCLTVESLLGKLSAVHAVKKQRGEAYSKEEIRLIKECVRKAAAPLKFVVGAG